MPVLTRPIPSLSPQDMRRFWEKVRIRGLDECWPWSAYRDPKGYGRFHVGSRTDGNTWAVYTHRVAWRIAHGPIPPGLCVCHHCDNPACCNPRHLFVGTDADNHADMDRKGRGAAPPRLVGERNGRARLTTAQVRRIRREYAHGGVSERALARKYGVTVTTIRFVLSRKTWAHLR